MPEVVTFGCRLNAYESEVMRAHASAAGLDDVIIFNTCTVTAEAERQARQAIRKQRRDYPNSKIIVTGCAVQIDPAKFTAMTEVDHVIGNEAKLKAETFQQLLHQRTIVNDIQEARETASHLVTGFEGMARAFVQVQNGCDHRCTFCIIPFGRGPSRSVPIGVIADQVRELVSQGYNEVVFTGVDITAYGADLPGAPTLGQMIRRVLALVPELPRLRLSSVDPVEIDQDLWHLIAHEPRLMPHLHLSLQSGDDMVLKRMKRRHTRADVIALCNRARTLRPDIVFGADIIAGFPTETDEMFTNTLRLVAECELTWLHVFPFSARAGTPAAKMPQVHGTIRKARAAQLRAAGQAAVKRQLDRLAGQILPVLVEQVGLGCAPDFTKLKIPESARVGAIVTVKCTHHNGKQAEAELVA